MGLEILIDPEAAENNNPAVTAILWTTGVDPQLIEMKTLDSADELRSWLQGIVVRFGAEDLAVRWTDKLRSDENLTNLVVACLGSKRTRDH